MKTTTLYHCDRCESTTKKAADLAAIKLPATMATSGNSDVYLCTMCRWKLAGWLDKEAEELQETGEWLTFTNLAYDLPPGAELEMNTESNMYRFASGERVGKAEDTAEKAMLAAWDDYKNASA